MYCHSGLTIVHNEEACKFSTTLWCNVRILIFHFFQWCLRRPFFSFWKVGIHIDMNLNTLEFLWYKLVFIYNKRFEGGPVLLEHVN